MNQPILDDFVVIVVVVVVGATLRRVFVAINEEPENVRFEECFGEVNFLFLFFFLFSFFRMP